MTLLICRTCPRYEPARSGGFGHALTDALRALPTAADLRPRYVQCLGGCPADGVAAVDGPGKARVRFTGLRPCHAALLAAASHAHDASPTGAPEEWDLPAELAPHLSSVTLKRAPTSPSRWGQQP